MSGFRATDHAMMARALRLAERGAYTTRPNPMVGCVVARDGDIVGEGWHQRAGGAHAEVLALRDAGERARGATAYVTLEPCAHHGRTPPCVDALIESGVARVVAALRDPFPQVAGNGFERLREAGIVVESGLMEAQARALNVGFVSRVVRGRPWVRVKLACSLDGRTAMASGDSKWITGEAARASLSTTGAPAPAASPAPARSGRRPALTVRFATPPFVPPLRVVLDPGLATVARGKVREGDAPTLYLHAPDAKPPRELTADRAPVPVRAGVFDLQAVLALLAGRGINEVHVEAGATLAGALLKAGLVDELLLYVAPVLLGDTARPLFGGLGFTEMAQRLQLEILETLRIGDDLRLRLRPPVEAAS